jgi:hypothetical protein
MTRRVFELHPSLFSLSSGLWCNWQHDGLRAPTRSVGRRVGEGSTPSDPIRYFRRVAQW